MRRNWSPAGPSSSGCSPTQVLHAGFELYRVESQDEACNTELQETPLTIPVRMITQAGLAGTPGAGRPSMPPAEPRRGEIFH
ncbi:hypothetical protein [Streptomyces phaeochromogenes]